MKFSQTERALQAAAVVFCATLILIILFGQTVKESGPAEWLSALLNLVMASATVAAYFTARNWLPQLTTQEGYRLAIRLVNDHFIRLGNQNRLRMDAWTVHRAAEEAFAEEKGDILAKALTAAIAQLRNNLNQSNVNKEAINSELFRMKTYGLEVVSKKKEAMDNMLQAYEKTINRGDSLLNTIERYMEERNAKLKKMPISGHDKREWQDNIAVEDRRAVNTLHRVQQRTGPFM